MVITAQPMTAADQKAHYEERGYITFPTMLDRAEVDVLQAALAELLDEASQTPDASPGGLNALTTSEKFSFTVSDTGQRHVRRIFNPIAHHQAFMDLVHNPKILDAV